MTNQNRAIEVWTSFKTKLQPLIYLQQHKTLLKEAIEFHLLQTSSFLMGINYNQITFDLPSDWTITPLTEPTVPQFDHGKLSSEWKEYLTKKRWNSAIKQQEENEKIVNECKELLEKLA